MVVPGEYRPSADRYYSAGQPDLEKQLARAGAAVLRDKWVTINRGEASLRVVGLDDPAFSLSENDSEGMTALVGRRLKELAGGSQNYVMLLSHRPEWFSIYRACGADLVLSGHAHGGQVRLPLIGGLIAPGQGFFPKYTGGLYEEGAAKMIVSRGLGNSLFPLRIHNRPDVMIITLGK